MKTAPSSPASKRQQHNERKLRRQKQAAVDEGSAPLERLEAVNRRAAGIDVGSAQNYVAISATGLAAGESAVRIFGVFSNEQDALVEWLVEHQISTAAMEATGIYWMSLYEKLEAKGIEVYLVDPHAVRAVPGRKSDWMDCQWLQKLHTYGLLNRAFRPDAPIRRLRTLTRQRTELTLGSSMHQQVMEKALISMNLQLNLVVSDIIGETGLRIIRAILEGERNPQELVKLRDRRCRKSTPKEMEDALTGTYDDEQLFVLQQSLEGWEFYQKQMVECDERIEKALAAVPTAKPVELKVPDKPVPAAQPTSKPKLKRFNAGNNAPTVDYSEALRRICGVDLMKVPGLNLLSVLMLIGEIGVDMSRWRSARAFCSWLGLCPALNKSGGKVLSRRTRKVNNRARTILRMAAWAAGKTDTWLGRFYRRIRARRGAPKAVTATARKLACIVYHMLKYREEFVPLDVLLYEVKAAEGRRNRLKKEAQSMGFELVPIQKDA